MDLTPPPPKPDDDNIISIVGNLDITLSEGERIGYWKLDDAASKIQVVKFTPPSGAFSDTSPAIADRI